MRIISGTRRGAKLSSVEGLDTRPTLDRVKESVFNMIADDVANSCVLDLFSGSGALGIEALSRGAKSCVFVDSNDKAIDCISSNLAKTSLDKNATVLRRDAIDFLSSYDVGSFDLVFLDPPYKLDILEKVLDLLIKREILKDGAKIIIEVDSNTKFEYDKLTLLKERTYGRVGIYIFSN